MRVGPGRKCRGFTLLEVIVAMTITGFVLGGLFSLVAGSKQMSWRAEDNLLRATQIRAATNYALLYNQFLELEPILYSDQFRVETGDLLEPPVRKTQPSNLALETYRIINSVDEVIASGSRWIQLDLPR